MTPERVEKTENWLMNNARVLRVGIVVAALLQQVMAENDVTPVMGGNALRVLRQLLP